MQTMRSTVVIFLLVGAAYSRWVDWNFKRANDQHEVKCGIKNGQARPQPVRPQTTLPPTSSRTTGSGSSGSGASGSGASGSGASGSGASGSGDSWSATSGSGDAIAARFDRIVGGRKADKGEWPWQTYIEINDKKGDTFQCGGSIIAQRWILTAAHCVFKSTNTYKVVVGEHDLNKHEDTEKSIPIERIYLHPLYNDATLENDIALMKLKKPIEFSESISPICLPEDNDAFKAGTECTIKGWGHKQAVSAVTNKREEDSLHEVEVPLVDSKSCAKAHPGAIFKGMLCAGYRNGMIDSCQGDSGGPLACERDGQWYQVGVVSWGAGCAQKDKYGVYADVAKYMSWIKRRINS